MVRNQHGFTLMELMVVVGIMGIVMAIAMPSLSQMVANQRIRDAAFDLQASMSRARSEALTRNFAVSVIPVSGNWSLGWTIADPNYPGSYIERHGPLTNVTVVGASVNYNPMGRLLGTPVKIDVSGSGTAIKRCISIDLNGRPHTQSCDCASTC